MSMDVDHVFIVWPEHDGQRAATAQCLSSVVPDALVHTSGDPNGLVIATWASSVGNVEAGHAAGRISKQLEATVVVISRNFDVDGLVCREYYRGRNLSLLGA